MNVEREFGATIKTAFGVVAQPFKSTLGTIFESYRQERKKAIHEKLVESVTGRSLRYKETRG